VINYDMPNGIEDYIHRIGRTGRAGRTGIAYSYFTADQNKLARDLVKILYEAKQNVPPELQQLASFAPGGGGGGRYGGGRGGGRGGFGGGRNSYQQTGSNTAALGNSRW